MKTFLLVPSWDTSSVIFQSWEEVGFFWEKIGQNGKKISSEEYRVD